jgi:hypothetical protein
MSVDCYANSKQICSGGVVAKSGISIFNLSFSRNVAIGRHTGSAITEAPRGLGATHIAYRTLHIELRTGHIIPITKKILKNRIN